MIDYTLTRSARTRRVSLSVVGYDVRVSAPQRTALGEIERFVLEHDAWITRRKRQHAIRLEELALTSPDKLLLQGKPLMINRIVTTSTRCRVRYEDDHLLVSEPLRSDDVDGQVLRAIKRWYRDEAAKQAQAYVQQLAAQFSRLPEAVFIKDTKTRWGSCSAKNVNLSWRLLMAPDAVFRYVVIHELCHLEHPNHSPDFWAAVGQRDADFKQSEHWLKRYGGVLHALI